MSQEAPPGTTEHVEAAPCLVVAPHFDDEVLGCGGLILSLTAAGAPVDVLFLTDGAAAAAAGEDPREHSRRRRGEAEAAAEVLGVRSLRCLDLPDGRLARHLSEAAAGIGRVLVETRPELLLIPSPTEVTADHRAAFGALHHLLAPLRPDAGSDEARQLAAAVSRLGILTYEVNHLLHPDLLVDVSARLSEVRRAMACYPSQLALHAYLDAYLGRVRFRTLSLGPEIEAAEAYRRLTPEDFITRGPAQLLRHLGAAVERIEVREGPLLSVIVRTRDRQQLLDEALASLAESTWRRTEVVLVNDGGRPPEVPGDFPLAVTRVDLAENRGRAGAAQAGVEAARGDFISFLDDDDLAAPEHLETLAGLLAAPGVRVAYTDSAVGVYELDAEVGWRQVERRLPYSRDFDPDLLLLDNYIPFNTLAIERSLFAEVGPFDPELPFFEDWDFLLRLAARVPFHHLARVTCEYRHFRGGGHHIFGAAPRERADFLAVKARVLARHRSRLTPELLARAVDRLRAEIVGLAEERNLARREESRRAEEAAAARRERGEIEQNLHRMNGELQSAAGDVKRLGEELAEAGGELRRLYGEEERLGKDLEAQTGEVARLYGEVARLCGEGERLHGEIGHLYGEIDRLGGLIRAMEGTRAWRFHQWWQRTFRKG